MTAFTVYLFNQLDFMHVHGHNHSSPVISRSKVNAKMCLLDEWPKASKPKYVLISMDWWL